VWCLSGAHSIEPGAGRHTRSNARFASTPAKIRHMICMSDGQTPPADHEGLAEQMNDEGITVSTVALGSDADAHLMDPFRIVVGDARLRLREAPDGYYRLIVLDAFSSDAIPVHLMTREALRLYLSKLAPGGALAFHISNRYLDLEPVVGALAKDANLVCRVYDDWSVSTEETGTGKEQSEWALLVRKSEDLGPLDRNVHWLPVQNSEAVPVWTDDFSNLMTVFKWK
jgi:hypothetical protein